jgi:DNA-binding CsgD family transcriptional regulator
MATLLDAIIDVVDAPLFVVGEGGTLVASNDGGRRLLESNGPDVQQILRTAGDTKADAEIATWTIGQISAWRRWIVVDDSAYALVVIEVARASVEAVLNRAVQTYTLTVRQSDVLRLILEGASNKEIASRLRMAPRTVEVHLTAIFDKTGVESRARLIAKAWDSRRPGSLRP